MNSPSATANCFAVHTHPGDGSISTERFQTAQERLDSLRQRAQEYFPGRSVPRTPSGTDEAAYLATLLGFFLMLNDGKVTLEDVRGIGLSTNLK
jgi:hypothetical protein